MTSVGIVIPAYRPDPATLVTYINNIDETISPNVLRVEIDDPTSETLDRIDQAPAIIASSDERRGKGKAITDGFDALGTDVLAFVDADGSVPPQSLADIIGYVDTDLVVGSRRHPDSNVQSHQSLVRRTLGDAFAQLARVMLNPSLYDYQCGAKALSSEVWGTVRTQLYNGGFSWDIELIAMVDAVGYDVTEVPVTWVDATNSTVEPLGTAADLSRTLVEVRSRAQTVAANEAEDDRWLERLRPKEPLVRQDSK